MNNKRTLLTLAAAGLASAGAVHAQYTPPPAPEPFAGFINEALRKDSPAAQKWDIGGSLRVRYDVRDGYGIQGLAGSIDFRENNADTMNDYFLERLRLRLGYTDQWWGVMGEFQGSYAQSDQRWAYVGKTAATSYEGRGPESDMATLHQAYATVGNLKEFPLMLKVGRQEMSYGDERLIGAFAWNNIGRTFDAAKVRFQNDWLTADGFVSRPVVPEDLLWNGVNEYDFLSGLYATMKVVPKNSLDVYFLSRNASSSALTAEPRPQFPQPTARDIYTIGFRLKSAPGEFGPWDYGLEAFGQFGNFLDNRAGAPKQRLEQQAYAVVAQGGYTFKETWSKPRLGLTYAHGSGDDDPTDNKHQTPDNLFPTNHKFYGYADFFSLENMHDVQLSLTGTPTPRLRVSLEGHLFWLAETTDSFYNVGGLARGGALPTPLGNGYGVNPGYDGFVGGEIDLVAGYAITRYAQIEAGYCHFFTGGYIDQSLSSPRFGAQDANFFYLQMNVNF